MRFEIKPDNFPKGLSFILLCFLVLGGLLVNAQNGLAQSSSDKCMNDNFNIGSRGGNLVCTAKEVYVAENSDGSKIIDAMVVGDDDCAYPGDTATVDIVATLHFNADRYDVGIYSATDGGDALFGSCSVDILPTSPLPATDVDHDLCGDVLTGGGGADLAGFQFQRMKLTCEDADNDGFLDFSTCFSWRTSGSNDVCNTGDEIFPGTKSKCFCETVNIPVKVPKASIKVVKTANPTEVDEPGDVVSFTVTITNEGIDPNNMVDLDALNDEFYGDLLDPNNSNILTNSCVTVDKIIGAQETVFCTFTAAAMGNAYDYYHSFVTASGQDQRIPPTLVSASDDAMVEVVPMPPTIEVVKTANATEVNEPGDVVTFTVKVTNTSVSSDPVTLTEIADDTNNDTIADVLYDPAQICDKSVLAANEVAFCTFSHTVSGTVDTAITDVVTVSGTDDEGTPVSDSDSATVTIVDVESGLKVVKEAHPETISEPGGAVKFILTVTNISKVDTVTVNEIGDDDENDGSIDGFYDPAEICVKTVLAPGEATTCTFTRTVTGNAHDVFTDLAQVTGTDDDGVTIMASGATDVKITDLPPEGTLTKTVTRVMATFEVAVTNDSNSEELTLTALTDDQFGDVTQPEGDIDSTTCSVPQVLQPGETYNCSFNAKIGLSPHINTLTGTMTDDDGGEATPSDSANVTFE